MSEFIVVVIVIAVIYLIVKHSFDYILRGLNRTILTFICLGFFMLILSGADIVSNTTALTITLVFSFIALIFDIYNIISSPEQVMKDIRRMKKMRYGFDERGNEIDFYKGRHCCGNCRFNRGRPAHSNRPFCEKDGLYTGDTVIPDGMSQWDRKHVKNDYCCRNWMHF